MRLAALALPLILLASTAIAQPSPQAIAASEAAIIPGFVGETGGAGRHPARGYADPRLPKHTLYAPVTLPPGVRLPIVAWGNGACADNGARYEQFLREIASHGYLVISVGPARVPAPPPTTPPPPPSPGGPERGEDPTQSSQVIEAIDFATAENARPGSRFFGRIDTAKVAVMGHSCGGLQAIDVARDPRVTTTVVMNSGIYTRPGGRSGVRLAKDRLADLHGPALYVLGGPTDIAYANGMDDFTRLTVPVFVLNSPIGHGGAYQQLNGGPYGVAVTHWLDWRLKGDLGGARYFLGPDRGACRDPSWTLAYRNLR